MIDEFSKAEIPATLYKFRNFNIDSSRNKSHFDDLINGELFFSSARSFNDPFDCGISINFKEFVEKPESVDEFVKIGMKKYPEYFHNRRFEVVIKDVREAKTLTNRNFIEKFTWEMQEELKDIIGLFSATTKNDNLLMWSHYAHSHTGFCYGFDTQDLMANVNVQSIGKVNYTNDYPIISPLDDGIDQLRQQLLNKAFDWKYEDEYRVLLMNHSNKSIKIPLTCIHSIYLGLCISEKDKEDLLLKKELHFPHAQVYQMQKSINEFRLKPIKI